MHRLLKEAMHEGHPLLEGQQLTFLWRGEEPAALNGDFNEWGRGAALTAEKVEPRLWRYTLDAEPGTYMEYNFFENGQPLGDPLNVGRQVDNTFGEMHHYIELPGWKPDPLSVPRGDLRGTLTSRTIRAEGLLVGGKRKVHFYQTKGPARLLIVYDGAQFIETGRLLTILDNLHADGLIAPVAVALVDHAGEDRFVEYAASETTAFFTATTLLDAAHNRLNLLQGPHAVMGASMGGLQALHTALRFPQTFSRALCISGAFRLYGHDFQVFPLLTRREELPLHVHMTVGRYDYADIVQAHPRIAELLRQCEGCQVTTREYMAGHNYTAWASELPHALQTLFPPE